MSGRSCRFRWLKDGFCWQTYQSRCLPRAFETACDPLGPEDLSSRKICLSVDSGPPSGCWRNSDSGRLAAIFSWLNDLNPMDFAIWRVLQAKSQGTPHTNLDALHLSIAAEWTAAATSKLWLRKMRLKLSRRSSANTHQPVLYRTTTSFNQTGRPLDGEKENILVHDSLPHSVLTTGP